MQALNLPPYQLKLRQHEGRTQVFDEIRKKYVALTPEEWVRQHFAHFLIQEKKFPASLMGIEVSLKYNQLQKRADILAYNKQGNPLLMVECKAPEVKITQDVFDQIARYNMAYKVKYLVVTNGINHFCCMMDYEAESYSYQQFIPDFEE